MNISVCAFIENDKGEILLVKTHARPDTWEFPGGIVESKESLTEAVCREVSEETGVAIHPVGVTGIYQNFFANVLCVVFYAKFVGGVIRKQNDEIQEAKFVPVNESILKLFITRPNLQSRYLDAIQKKTVATETWKDSIHLITRCEG